MFGSLTPLILGISSLKSSTGIVFHQASRHAAYSPSLTVLLCESIKIVASFLLLTRALHRQRRDLHFSPALSTSNGYAPLQAEDFEVQDTVDQDKHITETSPSSLEASQSDGNMVPHSLLQHVLSQVFQIQGLRLIVPALIYVVQNNLYLYAASELDPAFFQALWQMRILMSATLSWVVLKKRILPIQWLCILGIFGGVMLVKTATTTVRTISIGQGITPASSGKTLTASLALCAAAAMSSTAGVILEFIFRDRSVNLWASNVQLSCFSILPAACIVFFRDASHLGPVLHDLHTSPWPMGVVFCQSFNGMMIAILLKKAGVIINDFTSAVSIVLTFALNEMLFPASSKMDSVLDVVLVVAGSGVILGCSMLYHRYLPKESKSEEQVRQVSQLSGNDLHLEIDSDASKVSSAPSSSSSSPVPSSVATPLPRSPPGYFFDISTTGLDRDKKLEDEPLEMQDLHMLKPSS
ncbi:related to UDP-galactose transporter [Melanopsichium pennsylvanicum]|uniref:Related to UDP-galactose transporter n=2 Tax=Melanopsichium pennsylvanicum TaxID=63383 RepID=A0AAJ4XTL0_9BASI|nr:related to UDP-galactose transporter [Melanopsichium pennsylvanicum 4]SNX86933.1 related to UDP-galactose transporter [Melanopsichium pennsylvanicum]